MKGRPLGSLLHLGAWGEALPWGSLALNLTPPFGRPWQPSILDLSSPSLQDHLLSKLPEPAVHPTPNKRNLRSAALGIPQPLNGCPLDAGGQWIPGLWNVSTSQEGAPAPGQVEPSGEPGRASGEGGPRAWTLPICRAPCGVG